jgi:glycosyltransferase involved in cell wall biosynthesis
MKILHIYKSYYPESLGGMEKVIHSLSLGLAQEGIVSDVLACTRQKTRVEMVGKSRVYFYASSWEKASCPISFSLMRNFKKATADYDVLHYHFPWPFADFVHLSLNIKKPTIVSYHSDIIKQAILKHFYSPIMKAFFNRVDCIVVTSSNLLQTSQALKPFQGKSKVVPLGIGRQEYPEVCLNLLNAWKEKVGVNFFLFIGVLRYYKGLDFLLEAIRDTTIKLVIAGSGPEEKRLHEVVRKLRINNVTFLGRITEESKVALLTLCRGVVAPAHLRSEAFCVSLLEGLMFQKPLISTELGTGTSYVNQDGLSGIVVPPKNTLRLKEAMQLLLEDEVVYKKLQAGARQHYLANFTADKMCQDYIKIYKEVANQ